MAAAKAFAFYICFGMLFKEMYSLSFSVLHDASWLAVDITVLCFLISAHHCRSHILEHCVVLLLAHGQGLGPAIYYSCWSTEVLLATLFSLLKLLRSHGTQREEQQDRAVR